MSYYRTCPHCGAHLDPGERCDCRDAQREWAAKLIAPLSLAEKAVLWEAIKNIPASATNTDGDGVDQISRSVSASHDNRKMEELQA